MNRLDQTFARLRQEGRKALIGYLTAGFPDKKSFAPLVTRLEAAGLDVLEIGVPFSDPIADGPTIQQASQTALRAGATLDWILSTVRVLRPRVRIPLVFMSYTNPMVAMGLEKFFARAQRTGIDGLIIPDIIPEEADRFQPIAERHGVHMIYLVAPTSSETRLREVALKTRGFLYAVSLTGVTGARSTTGKNVPEFLRRVRAVSPVPVAVGFGLSTPDQVRAIAPHADGVIIGSALIKEIEKSRGQSYAGAARFVTTLRRALDATRKDLQHAS
jgi:tryptophan synthase alpha chain